MSISKKVKQRANSHSIANVSLMSTNKFNNYRSPRNNNPNICWLHGKCMRILIKWLPLYYRDNESKTACIKVFDYLMLFIVFGVVSTLIGLYMHENYVDNIKQNWDIEYFVYILVENGALYSARIFGLIYCFFVFRLDWMGIALNENTRILVKRDIKWFRIRTAIYLIVITSLDLSHTLFVINDDIREKRYSWLIQEISERIFLIYPIFWINSIGSTIFKKFELELMDIMSSMAISGNINVDKIFENYEIALDSFKRQYHSILYWCIICNIVANVCDIWISCYSVVQWSDGFPFGASTSLATDIIWLIEFVIAASNLNTTFDIFKNKIVLLLKETLFPMISKEPTNFGKQMHINNDNNNEYYTYSIDDNNIDSINYYIY